MPTTPRGIWSPNDGDDFDIITDLAAMGVSIDTAIGAVAGTIQFRTGTTANRPAVGAVTKGYLYYATDTNVLWQHNGTAWALFRTGTFQSVHVSAAAVGSINSGVWAAPTGIAVSTSVTTAVSCRARITLSAQGNGQSPRTGWSAGVALTGATTLAPAANTPSSLRFTSSLANSAAEAAVPAITVSNSWFVTLNPGTTNFTVQGIAEGPGGVRTIGHVSLIIEPVTE